MSKRVIIIGAGMGGLAAALRLRRSGFDVILLETRTTIGGLASSVEIDGLTFDTGPYILLDYPGLKWVFENLHLDLSTIELMPVDPAYQVRFSDGNKLQFFRSINQTADEFETLWPGSGSKYASFVLKMGQLHDVFRPHLYSSRPRFGSILKTGAWMHLRFLFRSLRSVLQDSRLPQRVIDSLSIWTHVAGQHVETAPSPMAFVPALIHHYGAYYPRNGIGSIPQCLGKAAVSAGVELRTGVSVRKISIKQQQVIGVITDEGFLPCDAVISNASGLSTYLNLVDETPERVKTQLTNLKLQSPGVCLYLRVRQAKPSPYLHFLLPGGNQLCRLFVHRFTEDARDSPARIIAPLRYKDADAMTLGQAKKFCDSLLSEDWWQSTGMNWKLLDARTPQRWGSEFSLYQNSMNPVMTGSSFRSGRLAHKSPWIQGLYLAGSSTSPGQWISFCGISGILAADLLKKDHS